MMSVNQQQPLPNQQLDVYSSPFTILQQSLEQSRQAIRQFSQGREFEAQMTIAFGRTIDRTEFASQVFHGDQPHLSVIDGNLLKGAYGAYSQAKDTIYLSQQFVQNGNVDAILSVLIEELGHRIDARLNLTDTLGDEGDIFSRLVRNQSISATELYQLKQEDDRSQIVIQGEVIIIEQAQDFNQDTRTDILWRNQASGQMGAWLMNGANIQSWEAMQTVDDLNWQVEATGDFNQDGKTDILWRNRASGQMGAWLMNGSVIQSWAGLETVSDMNWRVESTGDFNQDGKTDILWRNRASGQMGAWLMNGSVIQSWAGMETVSDMSWQVEGTGDFNQDSKTDILWRNRASGQMGAWLMNGATIQGWSTMPSVDDLNWVPTAIDSPRQLFDRAGNTIATAQNLGAISTTQVIRDTVGGSDLNDYYRFNVTQDSDLTIVLEGLSGDADLVLLDSNGTTLNSSTLSGIQSERISRTIAAGTYYIQIYPYGSNSTSYALSLTAISLSSTFDGAGNSFSSARNLGILSGNRSFQDAIGGIDINDYYRFQLDRNSEFSLTVNGLSADADVELLDANGEVIDSSKLSGSSVENLDLLLTTGTYYIRVYPYSGRTNYNLAISATASGPVDLAGNTFGTARDLGVLTSNRAFQDFVGTVDTNDYYRFTLNQTSDFRLDLTGLSADADVTLLDADGDEIQGSYGSFAISESIARRLSSGTYYIQVYPYSGSTNYNLALSAIAVSIADGAGNSLNNARNIGNLSGTQVFQDFVGSSDLNDYYRFTLTQNSSINFSLSDLSADADIELINSAGSVIDSSEASGRDTESISGNLAAGTYYIRVYAYQGANTNYRLSLAATGITAGFSSIYGYGMVNAAAAVARALGQTTPFADVQDLGGFDWSNDLINAPEAWARGYTGQGVVVAVIDSGVDINHQDLANNLWTNRNEIAGNGIDDDRNGYVDDIYGWNFGRNQNNNNVLPGTSSAGQGHGTHVAGTIAAGNNGFGMTGVAYGSRIMSLRLGNVDNSGSFTNGGSLAAAIRYAVDNGARVINMSLGWTDSQELRDALAYAASRNVITVSAAGNEAARSPGNPAQYATEYGLSVGAIDIDENIASFSNRAGTNSAMRHIVAPGVDIYSTTPGNRYGFKNGTSMAAPHVAGVVALMLSANPNLTSAQVREILINSAIRLS